MKKLLILLSAFLLFLTPSRADEFRGLWVDAWGAGFLTSAQVTTLVQRCRTYNYNAVVVQMRRRGDAFYLPQAPNGDPRTTALAAGYDALQDLITQCHTGTPRIEVHCWVTSHLIWSDEFTPPTQSGHVYNLHPEYLMQNSAGAQFIGEGYYLDPGHPSATTWNYNMAKDVVSRYDVDGFHWDYIRYPAQDSGYNPTAISRYNAEFGLSGQPGAGDPQFSTWRRRQVTDFLRWANADLLEIKPNIVVSCSVFGSRTDAYDNRFQDWAAWNNEGIIDICMPMGYTADNALFQSRVNDAYNNQGVRKVYMGMGAYLNTEANSVWQLNYIRNKPLSGSMFYSYRVPNSGTVDQVGTFTYVRDNYQPTWENVPLIPWKTSPTKGIVKGTVTRSDTGAILYNANVTISTSPSRTNRTEAHGKYVFFETTPGTYTLSVTPSGMGTASAPVTVTAGGIVTVDLVVPAADNTAPVISGISSSLITDSAATIAWTTDELSDSTVESGITTSYGSTTNNVSMVTSHSMRLTGLLPSTLYHYRVKSKNAVNLTSTSTDRTFTTLASGTVADIIIDNPAATVVGSWTTATSATDKFGTDYRYKGPGTGAAYNQFTPNILTAGDYDVYEWHSQGGNRSTDAPHVISYNGGTTTIDKNQQINGGQWNLLGRFNFITGTTKYVRITDNYTTGSVVIADAIKFVYATPALPAAPSGLTANAISSSQINLAWTDNSSDESNFVISRSTTSGGPYTDIVTLAANTTSYNNTGLVSGTTYYYVVRAVNGNGSSAFSNQAAATTTPAPPLAPSGLTATTISASQINLSWTDNSNNEDNFIVARSTTTGGPYTDIVTLAANTTSYNNTGLSANTTYYYVVRSINEVDSSANSNQASATTLQTPPAAPSGLTATTVSQTQINLSWTDNSGNETSFIVARSTTSGGPYTDIVTLGANVTSYNNIGLTANTTYFYVVRASNSGGASANSAQASATTLPNAPAAPSGLTATPASSSQINLSWTDNSSNESNFILARSTTAGGPYTDIATLAANSVSYNDTGLTLGTTYYYVVRATNAGGSSANSNEANATTTSVPNAPSGLTATAVRATRISLAWTDNSSDEVNFIVARSTTAGGPYTDVATLGANVTSYNNTGLTANTTYYYVVRASNAAGSSANSAEDSATTFETDLLIDNKSAVTVGVWSTGTAAPDKYGTDYVFASAGTGANYLQYTPWIATAGVYEVFEWHAQGSNRPTNAPHVINYNGGTQTVEVNQEINGGQWNSLGRFNFATTGGYVRITDGFVDAGVVIADAIQLVYEPVPAAPSGLTATAVSSSQINLSWTDNSSNEDNMIVARSTTSGGPYTDIALMSANSVTYNDTGRAANTTYYYVVRASNGSGSSANSTEASATTFPNQTTVTFTSVAAHDGYILESGETTGVGGTMSSTINGTAALRVGDDNTDKQYKTIVSFDTSSLPDGATIVSATLKLKRGSVTGTNPFTTHGTCSADIKSGGFGGVNALAVGDFQAVADATQVATMSNPTSNGALSTGTVNATGRGFVNKTGHTQFRISFLTDDNDDLGNDYTGFYPGDNATAGNRPVLEIVYE